MKVTRPEYGENVRSTISPTLTEIDWQTISAAMKTTSKDMGVAPLLSLRWGQARRATNGDQSLRDDRSRLALTTRCRGLPCRSAAWSQARACPPASDRPRLPCWSRGVARVQHLSTVFEPIAGMVRLTGGAKKSPHSLPFSPRD